MAGGRKPDYHLHAMDPDNICKGRIGGGWKNDDGSISIKLDPFIVLSAMNKLQIRLFINDYKESKSNGKQSKTPEYLDFEDEAPF